MVQFNPWRRNSAFLQFWLLSPESPVSATSSWDLFPRLFSRSRLAVASFSVAMVFAELAHFVFPFVEDGTFHYVSGMYTAALPLIPAGYGLYVTLSEIKKAKRRKRADLSA